MPRWGRSCGSQICDSKIGCLGGVALAVLKSAFQIPFASVGSGTNSVCLGGVSTASFKTAFQIPFASVGSGHRLLYF